MSDRYAPYVRHPLVAFAADEGIKAREIGGRVIALTACQHRRDYRRYEIKDGGSLGWYAGYLARCVVATCPARLAVERAEDAEVAAS